MTRQFFIAGAQRSGSTYLHTIVSEHPQIEMNQPWWPEPKFFLAPGSENEVDTYLKRYFSRQDAVVRGDKTVSYMEHPAAPARIAKAFPEAQIIFVLRDPVERAISNYWFSHANGLESLDIDTALSNESYEHRKYDQEKISGSPFFYIKRGRYVDYIEVFLRYFKCDQIKILVFEDLIGNHQSIAALYEYLQVDSSFVPKAVHEKINSYSPEMEIFDSTRSFLMDLYDEANRRLSEQFDVDLSSWRSNRSVSRQAKV